MLLWLALFNLISMSKADKALSGNLFEMFKMCQQSPDQCGTNSECCTFKQQDASVTGKFCITDKQKEYEKNGFTVTAWKGTFTDEFNKVWDWQCAPPPPTP